MDISIQLQDLDTHPAVILVGPGIYINPGPLLVATYKCDSIPFI